MLDEDDGRRQRAPLECAQETDNAGSASRHSVISTSAGKGHDYLAGTTAQVS